MLTRVIHLYFLYSAPFAIASLHCPLRLFTSPPVIPGSRSGILAVKRVDGVPTVFPADSGEVAPHENLLRVVYDKRPLEGVWDDFDTVRARVASEWTALPHAADNISASLREKVRQQMALRGKVPALAH
jgi:nicotinamide phosphoribosyltransferase